MARWSAVLFDLDGTLLDSVALILASFRHTFERHGLPDRSDREILDTMGTPLVDTLRSFSTEKVSIEALVETYREHSLGHHDAMARPYPGVAQVVRDLHAAGVPLGLVTSKKRHGAERGLRTLSLTECFGAVVSADDVTHGKPHPEPVERALRHLGTEPSETVFVGDSVHDVIAGRRAGVATAAVLWGPNGREVLSPAAPDHWVSDGVELRALLLGDAGDG